MEAPDLNQPRDPTITGRRLDPGARPVPRAGCRMFNNEWNAEIIPLNHAFVKVLHLARAAPIMHAVATVL